MMVVDAQTTGQFIFSIVEKEVFSDMMTTPKNTPALKARKHGDRGRRGREAENLEGGRQWRRTAIEQVE